MAGSKSRFRAIFIATSLPLVTIVVGALALYVVGVAVIALAV